VDDYEDFHFTETMADKAITWMRRQDVLAGVYYQSAVDRTYEVIFVRKK
jgi:hypothetical protein